MKIDRLSRTKILIDSEKLNKLKNAHVAVFGIGGVGGHAAESLARCGVGEITLVDKDVVDVTNLNRQIVALNSTIGLPKVEVMRQRILDIDEKIKVHAIKEFFKEDTLPLFDFTKYSYIIDAIDTVSSKILLIEKAILSDVKIISAMGTGNKLNPTMFEVTDIYKTSVCPLARVIRHELKKRNIKNLKVVYSKEQPISPAKQEMQNGKAIPGSFSFVPPVAGLILSSEAIKDIIKS